MERRRISVGYLIESLGSGGAERQLVALASHLDAAGFAARVLTHAEGDFHRGELESAGVAVHHVQRRSRLDPRPVLTVARWLRSGEVDLVHSFLYASNLYAVSARRLAGRGRAVVSERSTVLRDGGLQRLYVPWSFRHADLVVTNSEAARREIVERYGVGSARAVFVPNSVDVERFSPVAEDTRRELRRKLGWDGRRAVLTVGSFGEAKGHGVLLEALAGCHLDGSAPAYRWVGAPRPAGRHERVVERLAELGLGEAVELMGERADVVDLYRAADLLVLPSLWEGMPNVVLEALACGCPVVATRVSDVDSYVLPGSTGWLVPSGDARALCGALREASATPEARLREMGQAGRRHLLSVGLTPEAVAERHQELYRRLVS